MASSPKQGVSKIQAPKGTRDLYPEDALKRRYLEQSWRDASIRCGFEEIHGPTFETTDLYAVKSGEGILGELFQAYSGKAPEEVEQVRETGRAPYAMRPEFTPTLARMFAAKAGSLPRPCKWFTGGPYFRAERPQRGRLREFLQWNVDVIGHEDDSGARQDADGECIECCVALLGDIGLTPSETRVHVSSRELITQMLRAQGIEEGRDSQVLALLDRMSKMPRERFVAECRTAGIADQTISLFLCMHLSVLDLENCTGSVIYGFANPLSDADDNEPATEHSFEIDDDEAAYFYWGIKDRALDGWSRFDPSIVRGLAYYTGTVFEVLAEGERAIAGGGRYDKLIELMGGPPTPAVGFAMGDVVVSLLLEDKGLMPHGADLMEAVSRRPASVRPEVFVVGADDDQSDALVRRLSADLRRGVEADAYQQAGASKPWSAARYDPASGGVRPLHARVSYKSTRNLKKLLADGEKQHARLAAIVHGEGRVQLKDFDARRDLTPKDVGLSDNHAEFSTDPTSEVYVGRAAERLLS
jgi:histidyl-tRNA synthetase